MGVLHSHRFLDVRDHCTATFVNNLVQFVGRPAYKSECLYGNSVTYGDYVALGSVVIITQEAQNT